MTFTFIKPGFNDTGVTYTGTVRAKKINGVYVQIGTEVVFACYSDIRIDEMTEAEKAMPIYMNPGYPGRGY